MKTQMIIAILSLGLFTAWPTAATPPYTAIIIESGSPYFVPKSVTVSTGSPIRWENPTATEHTVTHTGCLEDGDHCAFDSGLMLPNGTFALPWARSWPIPLPLPHSPHHARSHHRHRGFPATLPDITPFPRTSSNRSLREWNCLV